MLTQASGSDSDLESQLVSELLGAPGMDLSIIAALGQLSDNHTDRLVMEGLQGDFALLGWESPNELIAHCQRLSISGSRAPHQLDADAAHEPQTRRIYAIDLRGQQAQTVFTALQQILQSRRTPTISLLPTPGTSSTSQDTGRAKPTTAPITSGPTTSGPVASSAPAPTSPAPLATPSPPKRTPTAAATPSNDPEDARLDALVNDLNDLDI